MKRSHIIILVLALLLGVGLTGLGIYGYRTGILISDTGEDGAQNETQETQEIQENQKVVENIESGDESPGEGGGGSGSGIDAEAAEEEKIVPFTYLAEKDGTLYTTRSVSKERHIDGAEIIPIDSELFAILGEDVYYITPGDEKYAPELRRCGTDGNNDISITEFASPIGSPAYVNGGIYSAYYTEVDEGMNDGIYRYDIGAGETKKAIEGRYVIYGYDRDYIYCSDSEKAESGTTLYRMDYDGNNKTEILSFPVPTDSIVVYGDYVFFSAFEDATQSYRIYRSPKDGNGNIDLYAFRCFSNRFDVIDGMIYYQADRTIYCSRISGSNESRLTSLEEDSSYAYNFLRRADTLYFTEQGDSERHFKYTESTGEKTEL